MPIDYHAAPLECDTELLERLGRWAQALRDPIPVTDIELDRIAVWINNQHGYSHLEAADIRADILSGKMKIFERTVSLIEEEKVSNRRGPSPASGRKQEAL